MIPLLSALAAAQTPVVPTDTGHSVTGIAWARQVVLARPEVYMMLASREKFTEGWILQLSADPPMLASHQVGEPVLYVGDVPAFKFNWDPVGGCVVVFVPGALDLTKTEVYFGSTELPERVTRARGVEERAAAVALGVRPLPADRIAAARMVGGAVLQVEDFRGVETAAMERVATCSSTPSDLQRSGIPTNR